MGIDYQVGNEAHPVTGRTRADPDEPHNCIQVVDQRLMIGGFLDAAGQPESGQQGCPRPLLRRLGQSFDAQ